MLVSDWYQVSQIRFELHASGLSLRHFILVIGMFGGVVSAPTELKCN